ncbi:hypothetical protein [Polaromonas sp.]|uniref:hypothetical protein n=1 Tax=Polaromonas sp. TaxID=1869339 RepID=UPI003BAC96B7
MPRLQINEDFGAGRLQTQARPIAQAEVAPQAQPSAWRGLAGAFAQGELLMAERQKVQQEDDRSRATAYANSMTVSELGKRIKAGEMLTSESPVFAATVQHVWGQNTHDALERDVLSQVTTGALKFSRPEEVDTYLTEARNTALAGASEYGTAGFDKGYNTMRQKLMDGVAKVNDKAMVENAGNQASDFLANTLLKVTGKDFKGTPQEAAGALLEQYQLLRHTKVMPDAAAKSALQEVAARAAGGGQKAVLGALLDSELPEVGTVRAFLGETKAQTFLATAGAKFDQDQRKRMDDEVLPHMLASDTGSLNVEKFMGWAQDPGNKDYISASTVHSILNRNMGALAHQQTALDKAQLRGQSEASIRAAQDQVDAALTNGNLWRVQGTSNPRVLSDTGKVQEFKVKDYAEQSLIRRTEGMPFEQQVSTWAMNGLKNPNWENILKAGLFNLSSIGVGTNGKPTGELNEAGKQAIELFKKLDAVNPDSAKETAGDTAYKRFSDIGFLMHMGRDASDAASIAMNSVQGAAFGSPADKLEKSIRAEADKLTSTPWLDWLANARDNTHDFIANNNPANLGKAWVYGVTRVAVGEEGVPTWLKGSKHDTADRNTTPNTSQVHSWVKRYATLLAHSGQVGDADQALKLAAEYVSNPAVSVKVNGTLYLRSELPSAPPEMTPGEWLEKFIDAVPKARAKELGFAGEHVRMEFDERSRVYRAFVAGLPLTDPSGGLMVYQKGAIQAWYTTQQAKEIEKAISRKQAQEAKKNRPLDPMGDAFVKDMNARQKRMLTKP